MLQYDKTAFGINTLFRIQGSAVYRACFTGLFSVVIFSLVRSYWDRTDDDNNNDELRHPYAVGILVAALTFLLVFRCQAAYGRYWEACSAVHHMMSKFMDATTHTAIYHLQCDHYKDIKPPVFFDYPELNAHYLSREREDHYADEKMNAFFESDRITNRATVKSIEPVHDVDFFPSFDSADNKTHGAHLAAAVNKAKKKKNNHKKKQRSNTIPGVQSADSGINQIPTPLQGERRFDGGWGLLFNNDGKATYSDPKNPMQTNIPGGFASIQGGRTPPIFLQELAHLSSLLVGVAFSTLRNDVEGAESPLDIYVPGSPWPEVDPTKIRDSAFEISFMSKFVNFLGMGRSAEDRTRYNASRPMPIVGGISDGEIHYLQMARGPYAKTQLCWQWLSEFIIREHLAGSTGAVGPPIISRIIQFLGDGMIYYNHARKIMFIPFPFPHAQLSAIYIIVAIPAVAFLMDQYTVEAWVGAMLTFLTMTALSGIHEVARELENPFRNVPNEIPLVTLQAQYNEALLTMYAGYHPDFFWKDSAERYKKAPKPTASKLQNLFNLPPGASSSYGKPPQPPKPIPEVNSTPPIPPPMQQQAPSPSLEAQIQELMRKMERQEMELEQLRRQSAEGAEDDHGDVGEEKKVQR